MAKKKSAKKPASKTGKKPARKPAKKPAKKVAKSAVKKAAKKPAKKAAKKAVARKPAKASGRKATGKPAPKRAPKAAKAPARQAASKVARKAAKKSARTAARKVSPKAATKSAPRKAARRKLPAPKAVKPVAARKAPRATLRAEPVYVEPTAIRPMPTPQPQPIVEPARPERRLVLVFMGPPGVGKGTQAAKLASDLMLPHISTGDLFRDHLKRDTPLGQKAKGFMNSGQLVPDELVIELVMDRIAADDCRGGYILDGFPRTTPQADRLAQALAVRGERVSAVFYFDAPREVIVERISGRRTCRACGAVSHAVYAPTRTQGVCDVCGGESSQRPDDEPEKVRQRLTVYDSSTGPLVPYYQQRGLLREFDAAGAVEDIYQGLKMAVQALA